MTALDGEFAAAADLYRRALQLRPEDAVSRIDLAKCLLEIGEREAGEAALRAATGSAAELAGLAITALAATSRGRFFLRPSAAAAPRPSRPTAAHLESPEAPAVDAALAADRCDQIVRPLRIVVGERRGSGGPDTRLTGKHCATGVPAGSTPLKWVSCQRAGKWIHASR